MDVNSMREVKAFHNPPAAVKDVSTATFLLLGESERTANVWTECKKLMTIDLPKRMDDFDGKNLTPETKAKAQKLLAPFDGAMIKKISMATYSMYTWAMKHAG